jgi:hypothetical protein
MNDMDNMNDKQLIELLRKNYENDPVMSYKINKLVIEGEEDWFNIEEKLNSIPIEDDIKPALIEKLRLKTNEYIYKYIPNYRQINFTNAKVNISLILGVFSSLYTDEERQNALLILRKIIAMELWVSRIVGKFYEIANNIVTSDANTAVEIYNDYENIYDSIPKPEFLESKDIAYVQALIGRILN